MANKTIDQFASDLQEHHQTILGRIANLDVIIAQIKGEIMKLIERYPDRKDPLTEIMNELESSYRQLNYLINIIDDVKKQCHSKPLIIGD